MAWLSSFARFINPGFAFFDKPWLFALLVFNLTLAGGITLFAIFASTCSTICSFDGKWVSTVTNGYDLAGLFEQYITPPYDEKFDYFEANFCLAVGRDFLWDANNVELFEGVCRLHPDHVWREIFPARNYRLEEAKYLDGTGGNVKTSPMEWCPGSYEAEQQWYNQDTFWCGASTTGDFKWDESNPTRQRAGRSVPFRLGFQYSVKTCYKTCPTTLEALSDANANLKYVELVMTLIVALILIPTGCVRAKSPIYKQDASISSVLRSADGMMVPPRAPHPPPPLPA